MNPENPTDPREALEPSLTALILGELPDEQARFLRQAIATDPELARTFERLKKTTALIAEAEAAPFAEPAGAVEVSRLNESRRQELLQRFKTVRPPQFQAPVRRKSSVLIAAAAVFAALMIATALLQNVSQNKSQSMARLEQLKSSVLVTRKGSVVPQSTAVSSISDASHSNERLLIRSSGLLTNSIALAENSSLAGLDDSPAKLGSLSTFQRVEGKSGFGLSPSEPAAVPNALLPSQQTIILPSDAAQEPSALYSTDGKQVSLAWGFDTQPQVSAGVTFAPVLKQPSPANDVSVAGAFHFGELTDKAPAQQTVPLLGDTPEVGSLFVAKSKDFNAVTGVPQDEVLSKRTLKEEKTALQGSLETAGRAYFKGPVAANEPQKSDLDLRRRFESSEKQLADTYHFQLNENQQLSQQIKPALPGLQTDLQKPPSSADFEVAQKSEQRDENEKLARVDDKTKVLKKQAGDTSRLTPAQGVGGRIDQLDLAPQRPSAQVPIPQPEVLTKENAFSTFSLNVSDVSFKLAAASLEQGKLPDPATIRSEEFINAFDYRDPEPAPGQPVAFAWDQARYPFAQNRDLLRFSIKTAAAGRQAGRPLNLVLLLDNSGSMERADRVQIIHDALRVLAGQLQSGDTLSVVTFARTARLWVDGVPGDQAGRIAEDLSALTPQGGTNLEEAMNLAYQTALRHYISNGINRVVLLTDGAANLGDTDPEALKHKVETNRKQGIALDCFGIGWEGYNDDLLETLTRNADGRYGFLNTPEEAASGFAGQLAGALRVAAADVKVQVEFNPNRVTSYRQVGYARHQLTKEQFRDNAVDAAEIGAAESGNALYVIETNPQGDGPVAVVRVRYKVPATNDYKEHEWTVPFTGNPIAFEQASPAMRLAGTASAFSEWLASSPFASEVTPDRLISGLNGVPPVYGADPRPQKLEWMLRQAKALSGK